MPKVICKRLKKPLTARINKIEMPSPTPLVLNWFKMICASGALLVLAACGSSFTPISASLEPSSPTVTQESTLTLSAQISGVGTAKVRFMEGSRPIAETSSAPYVAKLNLTAQENGTKMYAVDVLDNQNKVLAHSVASVVVNIPLAQAKEATLTIPLARKATLEADGNGMAAYYCRMAICAGDDNTNQAVRAFLEFSLGDLPEGLSNSDISNATLRVYQNEATSAYAALGALHFEHVDYGATLIFDSPVLHNLGISTKSAQGYQEVNVLEAVRDDWANRSTRSGRSQYRLRMDKPSNNDSINNLVLFGDADPSEYAPQLVIRYKLP